MQINDVSVPESHILDPLKLELSQRHLIEASAGTGKTFNITRLYARLILEKKLAVQEILVMTFTKAATEEIRSRVATFLQEMHDEWYASQPSEFTQALQKKVDREEGEALLTAALLSLDEASIFTIHGFCQRVLQQFAVTLSTDLEPELMTDPSEINMQAIQDWLRVLARDESAFALLATKNWHEPEKFYIEFSGAIASDNALQRVSKEELTRDYVSNLAKYLHDNADELQAIYASLQSAETIILDAVVEGHKQEDTRRGEWQAIMTWFDNVMIYLNKATKTNAVATHHNTPNLLSDDEALINDLIQMPKAVGDFVNKNRFRSAKEASNLLQALRDFRDALNKFYKAQHNELQNSLELNAVLAVAESGIYAIRNSIEKAKQQAQLVGFDDLVRLLSVALNKDELSNSKKNAQQLNNSYLIEAIRKQFPVALVDEFQDTDEHQYQILDRLYPKADKNSMLLMIGDPKQAIYGFRGGDIFVYLEAKKQADYIWVMDTNWRSSAQMVASYNRLFWGHAMQEPQARPVFGFDINYELIKATSSSKAAKSPLRDPAESRAAMTYMLSSDGMNVTFKEEEKNSERRKKAELEKQVLEWTALEIKRLLADTSIGDRALLPADIAILVRGKAEAKKVRECLDEVGLTAVYLSDKTPLFESAEAIELYRVLDAILHNRDSSALLAGTSSSLLSRIIGNDASITEHQQQIQEVQNDLAHPLWETISTACVEYKTQWFKEGIFSLLLNLIKNNYNKSISAERSLTNMLHLAEALAKNALLNKLPEQQLAWFSHQIFNQGLDEEMQLRLESDANLIKIVTQHGSKGLEYPIVFLPFANHYKNPSKRRNSKIQHFKYQDTKSGQSIYQLGATTHSLQAYVEQAHAEEMRLLYVAVTRAEYRCYLGMVDDDSNSKSALNLALGIPEVSLNAYKSDDEAHSGLKDWLIANAISSPDANTIASNTSESLTSESLTSESLTRNLASSFDPNSCLVDVAQQPIAQNDYKVAPQTSVPQFELAQLCSRSAWIISSFSNLSRFPQVHNSEHYDLASPNQISLHAMENTNEHLVNAYDTNVSMQHKQGQNTGIDPPSAMRYQLQKGAETGNLLHDILEEVDFHSPDWHSAASAALTKYKALDDDSVIVLFAWLDSCLQTPLQGSLCLANLRKESTLREAEFYFPMPNLKITHIATLLSEYRQHILQQRGFEAQTISMPNIPELTGMMHGFIDLIFESDGKYFVADYKSTHLGESPEDYTSEKLHENNQHHLYDLQYLLYSLALHKYLKQHLADYSFEQHFGGVYYLYLRGMSPQQKYQGESTGVFFDKLHFTFIQSLERLFNHVSLSSGKES